jgi:hypothetical protein
MIWYIGPYEDARRLSGHILQICIKCTLSCTYIFTRCIIYTSLVYQASRHIYRRWYRVFPPATAFGTSSDTSDDLSSLGIYHRTSTGAPTMLHNFIASDFPSNAVSISPFRQGGVGTAISTGTDVCTWFFAPLTDYDGFTSVLGLYCMKTTTAPAPVLVHMNRSICTSRCGYRSRSSTHDKSTVTLSEPFGNNSNNPLPFACMVSSDG